MDYPSFIPEKTIPLDLRGGSKEGGAFLHCGPPKVQNSYVKSIASRDSKIYMHTLTIPFLHSIKKFTPSPPPPPIRAPCFRAVILMRHYDTCGYAVLLHGLRFIFHQSNIAPTALGG